MKYLLTLMLLFPISCFASQYEDLKKYFPMNDEDMYIYRVGSDDSSPSCTVKVAGCSPDITEGCVFKTKLTDELLLYAAYQYVGNIVKQTLATSLSTGIPAKVNGDAVLKSPIKKGTKWNREHAKCEIVEVKRKYKVISGEYNQVAVVKCQAKDDDNEINYEYYAPKIGKIKTEVVNNNNKRLTVMELIEYKSSNEK